MPEEEETGIYNEYLPTPQDTSEEQNIQENLQEKDDEAEEEKERRTDGGEICRIAMRGTNT